MKKLKKILLLLVVLVIVVVLVVSIVIGTSLGKIVKIAIENVAPKITQTSVTVDSVNISLLTGSAGINSLVVGNPDGYKTPSAISVGKAAVSISPGSLLSDKIVVKSVEVREPEITFEGNPIGANNLSKILDSVKGAPDTNAPATSASTAQPASNQPGKKLEVDDFLFTGAKVHANISGMGSLTSLAGVTNSDFTLTIPDIHLTDLGKGSDGITAAELTKLLLQQVNSAVIAAVGDYAKTNLSNAANGLINGVKSNAGGAVSNGVDQLKKGLGGFLNGK